MFADDVNRLLDNYSMMARCLEKAFPQTASARFTYPVAIWNRQVIQYDGLRSIDPYEAAIALDLASDASIGMDNLALFNVVDRLCLAHRWSWSWSFNDAISIDESMFVQSASYDMFIACCLMLNVTVDWVSRYAIGLVKTIDIAKPFLLAKAFTASPDDFMACICAAKSLKLQALVKSMFASKCKLNPSLFRRVLSLYQEKLNEMNFTSMFTN